MRYFRWLVMFLFVSDSWNNINKAKRKLYLKNVYRVLLTRARQGMVIVVPEGDGEEGILWCDVWVFGKIYDLHNIEIDLFIR